MVLEHFLFCGCLSCDLVQLSLNFLLSISAAFDVVAIASYLFIFKFYFSVTLYSQYYLVLVSGAQHSG